MAFFRNLPLSRKILLGIVPLFLLFISIGVLLQNRFQEKEMMEQAQTSAYTYAEIVRESLVSMMISNQEVDSTFLDRVNGLPQFDTLQILVNDLRLREELRTPDIQARLEKKSRDQAPRDDIQKKAFEGGPPVFIRKGDHFRGVIPFNATKVCQRCHAVPVGYTLGATDLSISFERISQAATGNWQRSLLIFLIFTALVITVATVMFTRFVSKPVDRLVGAANAISRGNLDHAVPDVGAEQRPESRVAGDELAFLADRFGEMRQSLKEKIDQLDLANRTLSERNRAVEDALARLRQAQEDLVLSERLAVTGKLTAQLSHEINNPIHNIQSLLESAQPKVDPGNKAHELIAVALEEVSRMAKLTRSMLELYRGSTAQLERDAIDVRGMLEEVLRMYEEPLGRRDIRIGLRVDGPLPPVQGSRDKLKQVMLNLINNARDAMPAGGSIAIRAYSKGGSVCVETADSGSGIAPEHLGRIFDAFFTTKKEVSGVGLGLSVSYGIIQQHGGTIGVSSTPGKGSVFTVQLPAMTGGTDEQGQRRS
jgi:signal transduction histidine kinase